MWIQGRENVPTIPNRKTLQFWSVRHAEKNPHRQLKFDLLWHKFEPLLCNSFPLQMITCMQVCILTSWAQMRLCLGPWEGGQPSGRSSMTPGGWTVSKGGREELNADDCRLWILSFYLTTACFNPLPLPLCLSVFILQSLCLFRSSRSLTVQKRTTINFTSSSVRRVWKPPVGRAPPFYPGWEECVWWAEKIYEVYSKIICGQTFTLIMDLNLNNMGLLMIY